MSHPINTKLLEEAAHHIDYWEGTPMARILEADLENNDLDSLHEHLKQSRAEMFEHEYSPGLEEVNDVD